MHCHFGPDAHRERSVDALDAARDAAATGHAAVVLKSHDCPTAGLAPMVDRVVDGVRVFGGICCDRPPSVIAGAVRAIGAERCTLATDSGQKANVRPASGFQDFADALLAEGLDECAIRWMACDNPCALVGVTAEPAHRIRPWRTVRPPACTSR